MKGTVRPRVKICCISSVEEARMAIDCGASAVGLVSAMPTGPGILTEDQISEIASTVPPPIATFLLTSRQDAKEIIKQQQQTHVNTLQLCNRMPTEELRALHLALPNVRLVQVIHIAGADSLPQALAVEPFVDALLLDSGAPQALVPELGGTGRVHDWKVSLEIRERVDVPVFLAGGLKAGNVRDAISTVAPFALDVCTGVRTRGRLDHDKLKQFFAAAWAN